jgi:tetratricopeptide (TPR) repeat protein
MMFCNSKAILSLMRRSTEVSFKGCRGFLLASGATFLFVACFLFPAPRVRAAPPAKAAGSDYVSSETCSTCHQNIAQQFHTTGMGRSFYRPTLANTVEDYKTNNTLFNKASGLYYTMLERNGTFYQRRYEIGFDGRQTNVAEEKIDYVIGSGEHARTYLHRGSDGRLIELPVSWYTENSGYWAMSPGYDRPEYQEDFRRAIPGECVLCHNALPLQGKYPDRASTGQVIFPQEIPEGVDCQRCHGPGGAHVQAALSGNASTEKIRQAIVNPARLSRDRQLEVCMQCHLETSSRLAPNEIRRYGREIGSYKPGEPLGDYTSYFDRASSSQSDTFEIVDAAYRLRMSACFRASQMTCLTCHDPHQPYRTTSSTARYLATCQGCHQSVSHKSPLPAGSDCLSCHMPKRRTEDVVHVVMTDHYIQRLKPERDLLAPMEEAAVAPTGRDRMVLYYPSHLQDSRDNELYLAVAEAIHGTDQGLAHLQTAIAKYAPAEPEFYLALGDGYSKAGKQNEAIRWYNEALLRRSNFRPAIKQLAVALISQGQFARAAGILQNALATSPADDAMLSDLGNIYLHQKSLDRAQQALLHALEINPEQPEAQNLLGLVAIQKADPTEAEARFRGAITSQPNFAEAHNNLANLLTSASKYEEAQYHFKKALSINPKYAEAHYSYGLLLELMQQYDPAVIELEQAVRFAPQVAQEHDDFGDLLKARGEMVRAVSEYREAIHLNSNLADAHSSLADILAIQGKDDEAEKEFRAALQLDANIYEAHLGLGMILQREGKAAEARLQLEKAAQSPDPATRRAAQSALTP